MQIFKATEDHIEFISHSLVDHYTKANEFFQYPKYKDDYEIMHKHVSKRISGAVSDFKYLVCEEDGDIKGFINFSIVEGIGQILMIVGEEKECLSALVQSAVDEMKSEGVKQIEGEVFAYEQDVLDVLNEMGMKKQLINFRL